VVQKLILVLHSSTPMTSSNASSTEEPTLAEERRDNRIVAFVMGTTVFVYLVLLYAH
jgi:hypothetical protein